MTTFTTCLKAKEQGCLSTLEAVAEASRVTPVGPWGVLSMTNLEGCRPCQALLALEGERGPSLKETLLQPFGRNLDAAAVGQWLVDSC